VRHVDFTRDPVEQYHHRKLGLCRASNSDAYFLTAATSITSRILRVATSNLTLSSTGYASYGLSFNGNNKALSNTSVQVTDIVARLTGDSACTLQLSTVFTRLTVDRNSSITMDRVAGMIVASGGLSSSSNHVSMMNVVLTSSSAFRLRDSALSITTGDAVFYGVSLARSTVDGALEVINTVLNVTKTGTANAVVGAIELESLNSTLYPANSSVNPMVFQGITSFVQGYESASAFTCYTADSTLLLRVPS
jgi:hypothetical protein